MGVAGTLPRPRVRGRSGQAQRGTARGQGKRQAARSQTTKAHPSAFNDVTSGINDMGTGKGFSAGKGWDPATGLGTPNFEEMKKAL